MVRKSHLAAVIGSAVLALVPAGASASPQDLPVADVQLVSMTANVKHAHVGDVVTFTIVGRNNGPDPVDLYIALVGWWPGYPPADFTFGGTETCSDGISADTPACEWMQVPPGPHEYTVTAPLIVNDSAPRMASNTACASTSIQGYVDTNPTNDCITTALKIVGRRQHT